MTSFAMRDQDPVSAVNRSAVRVTGHRLVAQGVAAASPSRFAARSTRMAGLSVGDRAAMSKPIADRVPAAPPTWIGSAARSGTSGSAASSRPSNHEVTLAPKV